MNRYKKNSAVCICLILLISSIPVVISETDNVNDATKNLETTISNNENVGIDTATDEKISDYFDSLNLDGELYDKIVGSDDFLQSTEIQDVIDSEMEENDDPDEGNSEYENTVDLEINDMPSDYNGEPFVYDENGNFVMYKNDFEEVYNDVLQDSSDGTNPLNSDSDCETCSETSSTTELGSNYDNGGYIPPDENDYIPPDDGDTDPPDGPVDPDPVTHLSVDSSVDNFEMPSISLGVNKDFNTPDETLKYYVYDSENSKRYVMDFNGSENDLYTFLDKTSDTGKQVAVVYEPRAYSYFSFNPVNTYPSDCVLSVDYNVNQEDDINVGDPAHYSDYSDDIWPYPISDEPWIELMQDESSINGQKNVKVKLNIEDLEPGSYLAYIVVTPLPPGYRDANPDIPEEKLAAVNGEIRYHQQLFDVEQKRIPVRINIWADGNSGNSIQYDILGNAKDQTCSYVDGGLTGKKRSVIVDLKDICPEGSGDSLYWIHSFSGCDVDVLPHTESEFRRIEAGEDHHYIRIVTTRCIWEVEILLHIFPDYENVDDIESNEITYRFFIKFDDFNEDKFPDYGGGPLGITVLPSIGEDNIVEPGKPASFNVMSWNKFPDGPESPYKISPLADLGGAPANHQRIALSLSWYDLENNDPSLNERILPPSSNLPRGGSLFGEYVHYRITCGGGIVPEGDIPGRMIHRVSIDTSGLAPGEYTYSLTFNARWTGILSDWFNTYGRPFVGPSGKPLGGFAILGVQSIPLTFTVVDKEDSEEEYYKEKITPRLHSLKSNKPYLGQGLDIKLNSKEFSIIKDGSDGYQNYKPVCYTRENPFHNPGEPEEVCNPYGIFPSGSALNIDRSYMFDIFPKICLSSDKALVIPRYDGYAWSIQGRGNTDPAIGKPMTSKVHNDLNTYAGVNGKIIRVDPAKPFDTLKAEVINPTSGVWPDELPPTYHFHPGCLGFLPRHLHNEIDSLDWYHRRNPHVGSWVNSIEDVPVGTTLKFRANIDLTALGEPYHAEDIIFPLYLKYLLPDGVEYQEGSAKARPGMWVGSGTFSWTAKPISFEPKKVEDGLLSWYIPPGSLINQEPWPWKVLGQDITTSDERFDYVNVRFYHPTGTGIEHAYLYACPNPAIEITFNATITNECQEDLSIGAYLDADVSGGRTIKNIGDGINSDNDNVLPISRDTVSLSTKNSNQPPELEAIMYPENGETDVPVMNDELSVKVSDPDGDPVSVSFYWASDDCLIKEDTYEGGVPGHLPPHTDVYEWKTKHYMIQTKYDVPSGSIVSVDPRPVVYKSLPGPVTDDIGTGDDALILKDPVIQGLEFNKVYSWYVVVHDKSSSTYSNVYHFTTADTEPELNVDFSAQYSDVNSKIKKDVNEVVNLRNIEIGVGENLTFDLNSELFDPEGLIRGFKWACNPVSDNPLTPSDPNYGDGIIVIDPDHEDVDYDFDRECHCPNTEHNTDRCRGWINADEDGRRMFFTGIPGEYELTIIPFWDKYDDLHVPETGPPADIGIFQDGWPGYPDGEYLNYFLGFLLDGMPQSLGYTSHEWVNEFTWTINVVGKPFAIYSFRPENPDVGERVVFDGSNSYDSYNGLVDGKKPTPGLLTYNWTYKVYGDSDMEPVFMGSEGKTAYNWSEPGKYNVTLEVTDEDNLKDVLTKTIVVGDITDEDDDNDGGDDGQDDDGSDDDNPDDGGDDDGGDDDTDDGDDNDNEDDDDNDSEDSISIEVLSPLENKLYFRNKKICNFPATLIIGPVDIEFNVNKTSNVTVTDIGIFVDDEEIKNITFDPSEDTYNYTLSKRMFFRKTIKITAFNQEEEVVSKTVDAWVFNFQNK